MDVTVSGSPEDPLAPGHVILVQNGYDTTLSCI